MLRGTIHYGQDLPLPAVGKPYTKKDRMASLIKLQTIDTCRETFEHIVNTDYINYLHEPVGAQLGGAVLRMHEGGGKALSFVVSESLEELRDRLQGFVRTEGVDHLVPANFQGKQVLVNASRVMTYRRVAPHVMLVTFADGSERYFRADDVTDRVMAAAVGV